MASTKSGGTASNLNDSNPKYLGVKLYDGEKAQIGSIIVRQRGTKILAGKNVGTGKDHTLFASATGTVSFGTKRSMRFNNRQVIKRTVSVIPSEGTPTSKKPKEKKITPKETIKVEAPKTPKKKAAGTK